MYVHIDDDDDDDDDDYDDDDDDLSPLSLCLRLRKTHLILSEKNITVVALFVHYYIKVY